eukprot:CAMPEP_0205903980 /NCGR_PEP_ID=MMETSP1325-20131115/430_1 /ASSEMBLY_ACC=CAM_ASM_000708 /TAXON_ID=236786 /ORGANISM="Florenciella sp., Strain RCC1007" /LENGTH=200 /DNA_ID=CAMNT_0053269695 /DNA_START=1044 /DNA_END=1644 /DNA_ORIENTATION=+
MTWGPALLKGFAVLERGSQVGLYGQGGRGGGTREADAGRGRARRSHEQYLTATTAILVGLGVVATALAFPFLAAVRAGGDGDHDEENHDYGCNDRTRRVVLAAGVYLASQRPPSDVLGLVLVTVWRLNSLVTSLWLACPRQYNAIESPVPVRARTKVLSTVFGKPAAENVLWYPARRREGFLTVRVVQNGKGNIPLIGNF